MESQQRLRPHPEAILLADSAQSFAKVIVFSVYVSACVFFLFVCQCICVYVQINALHLRSVVNSEENVVNLKVGGFRKTSEGKRDRESE